MGLGLTRWVVCGTTLIAFAVAAEPVRGELPADSREIVGAWVIDAGMGDAVYRFQAGGSFSLTFEGRFGGSAGGTWRVEGGKLMMRNTWSEISYTKVGETESAEIVSVTPDSMELRSTDIRGKVEVLKFQKMPGPAPLAKGKAEHANIVGTYRRYGSGELLSLSADGTVILTWGQRAYAGVWAEAGGVLTIRSKEMAWIVSPDGKGLMSSSTSYGRPFAPAEPGRGTTRPSVATTRPAPTTRPAGVAGPRSTTRPSIRIYSLAPVPTTSRVSGRVATTQAVRIYRPAKLVELNWPVLRVDEHKLFMNVAMGDGSMGTAEFVRIEP
jgi:hypothetical protein